MTARRRGPVGALLGALLLAGCTGGGSAGPDLAAGSRAASSTAAPVGLAGLTGGSWSVLETSPLHADVAQLFWDGTALVELASQPDPGGEPGASDSLSAAYRPGTRTWQPLRPPPGGLPGGAVAAVLTTRGLVMVGDRGADGGHCCAAAVLPPGGSGWQPAAVPPLHGPSLWGALVAVPAGAGVLVVHARDRRTPVLEAASYDPAADRWTRLDPPTPRDHPPMVLAAAPTPQGPLLWSLWSRTERTGNSITGYAGVDVFRLGPDSRWSDVTGGWPQGDTVGAVVPAGDRLLLPPGDIWCGACSHPAAIGRHGYLVDPATLARTPIPVGPVDHLRPALVWTGAAALALNGGASRSGPAGTVRGGYLAAWAPGQSWVRLPRAPLTPGQVAPVWADGRLLVLAADGRLMAFTPSRGRA